MVVKESNFNILPFGAQIPQFELPNANSGMTMMNTEAVVGKEATVVMILSCHCPFVVMLKSKIAEIAQDYTTRGVGFVAIGSNSEKTHPQDGPEFIKGDCVQYNFSFPYLFDESQDVARSFGAMCTPDFYVFDKDGKLAYHGRFDASTPGNSKPTNGEDLRAAIDAILAGEKPQSIPSMGCNLKWHPGSEPQYFV